MARVSGPFSKIKSKLEDDDWVKDSESVLHQKGIYLLMGEINEDSAKSVVSWILASNIERDHKELTLMIHSNGGELTSAFAIVDIMFGSSIPISTVGLGCVASCGLIIFMAGTKGKRILTPNTQILSHQYSWSAIGKEHELMSMSKEYSLMTERVFNHYKKCTGLKNDKIREVLLPPSDVWLSAQEALEFRICDEIKLK